MLNTIKQKQKVRSCLSSYPDTGKKLTPLFFLALAFSFSITTAQITIPEIEWQNNIGGNDFDWLNSIQQTTDGGYIMGGYSWSEISGDKTEDPIGLGDFWIVKLNSTGSIEWQNDIGGSMFDNMYSIQQTTDGGYILGGNSYSGISGDKTEVSQGIDDYWVIKLDSSGAIEWQNTIGGSESDILFAIQQTGDSGYILGGYSFSGISGDKTEASQGGNDYWVVKLDNTGAIEWQNTIGGEDWDFLTSIQQTTDGEYILSGFSESGKTGDKKEKSQGGYDCWVVKLNSTGGIEWQNTIGGSEDEGFGTYIQQTTDGGYILGGSSTSGISGDKTEAAWGVFGEPDYWIVKLNSTGAIEWQNTIGGDNWDELSSIQQTTDGGYIVGGSSPSGISGNKTESSHGFNDYWVVKLDSTGDIEWQKAIGGSSDDYLLSTQQTAEGGYVLGGASYSGISGDKTEAAWGFTDYWVVKLYPDACIGKTVYADVDGDTYGDGGNSYFAADCIVPAGYVFDSTDCNDTNAGIHPGACDAGNGNGVDDNCDGIVDDGYGAIIYYTDSDSDGYGTGTGTSLCGNPGAGYSTNNNDCNDALASVHPGAIELLNGIDDDCNGVIDDAACPFPAGLSVTGITGTSAKLNWDDVPGAVIYLVRYKASGNSERFHVYSVTNSKHLSNLSPNTHYTWAIKAYCSIAPRLNSDWSAEQSFTTGSLRTGDKSSEPTSLQIYPNPAGDVATIQFTLSHASPVRVEVCDVSGRKVTTLLNDELQPGEHSLQLNTSGFSKGVYFVKMISDFGIENRKLVVQ